MTQVALLHAYSPLNAGDGLLVEQALDLIHDAVGADALVDIFASRPDGFTQAAMPGTEAIGTRPGKRGYSREYLRRLAHLGEYDLIVGVGGGYLRFGHPLEAAKTWLVHMPQLARAASAGNAVYLPQSCGPLGPVSGPVVRHFFRRMGSVMLRDDRSVSDCSPVDTVRAPDCGLLGLHRVRLPFDEDAPVIVGTRQLRRGADRKVEEVARRLAPVEGLVQSRVGANNDEESTRRLGASQLHSQADLRSLDRARVVISVRLHGALMALAAGHYVIHLSYERKGFGAFSDLGLDDNVHNVYSMDVDQVIAQAESLREDPGARQAFDATVEQALPRLAQRRNEVVERLMATAES
ncbi:polysaccharide pyruvyl transferase family protein [Acidipropionibacterium acidipropionici]|uniref:Polysaccharide pyruvyl transferase domain-containing protein n=1 Tax=Acidipropionibacterium acidipropionici TaxID=1748 RepID=A0AAC9FCH5_9ACTN|nr:polysaccharide pyruvyl transferase family protein [Acidipropionibacterium acidipropionici]AMS06174.1 hypothetical protein AXH35_12725 [Acidipropionibacterium acidipropionici]AOZ47634.1 hypothetical protein A8L58_14175 [Acidipropionibacterium acidipropionici]AZP39041.1 polysaccharide pyruvyl transferase family protein [Acidipropionibacterium acidipropionici]